MKVAFDEHIPPLLAKVFVTLASEGEILGVDIVIARNYITGPQASDVPWITNFAADGGSIIISGDVGIRSKPHEIKALQETSMIVFFFTSRWSRMNGFVKSAMLLNWWPKIREYMNTSSAGDCWEIPFKWNWEPLKQVTPP